MLNFRNNHLNGNVDCMHTRSYWYMLDGEYILQYIKSSRVRRFSKVSLWSEMITS